MQSAELDRLGARVRASTRDGGLIETAQIKLIGLDEVREAAGARWSRMRDYVRDGSIKIIAARIGQQDAVIPCGDGFLVVFADASREQSARRCAELREALLAFYLGEQALAALRADVEPNTVSAANLASLVASNAPATNPPQRNMLTQGRFFPIWAVQHRAVGAYLCAPVIGAAGAAPRLGYTPDFLDKAWHEDTDFLDLDLSLFDQACEAAGRVNGLIGVTVHTTTMRNRKARTKYLQHLSANAGSIQRRMFITIAEIAPGTPLMLLVEWSRTLKNTFARVALDLHHSDRALEAIGSTGAWAAGYHMPSSEDRSEVQLRATLNKLDAWCKTLRRQGIQPFVNGFADSSLLDLASYSDLTFALGEALWPSTMNPGTLLRIQSKHGDELKSGA